MKRNSLGILAVLSSVILLTSCLNNNNNTTQPQSGAFLVAQVSPTAPANVGVYINNGLFDTMHFGVYTPYVTNVSPGTYTFMVDSFGSSTHALTSNVTIEAKKNYSYFIIDSFSKVKAAVTNDVIYIPSSDSSYVRFFNFCPNATEPLSLVETTSGSALSANRTFNDQQNNSQFVAFQEVPAGNYSFSLKTVSGTVLKTQNITLTGGKVYTLYASGTIGNADTTRAISIGKLENYPQR